MTYTHLGTFFQATYPNIYKTVCTSKLSGYLRKAADRGIVYLGRHGLSGDNWAELTSAYCKQPPWDASDFGEPSGGEKETQNPSSLTWTKPLYPADRAWLEVDPAWFS